MFSGIIDNVANVRTAAYAGSALTVELETGYTDLEPGESVAVNGVCVTVSDACEQPGIARFFASPETLARTNLDSLVAGKLVNTERAVRAGSRLSGHLVQGHIDGTATVAAITSAAGAHILEIDLPPALARYCIEKGSITLDGISLTLNSISVKGNGNTCASITIVPYTWEHTTLNIASPGDAINVEVDVIAKYVERLCQPCLSL